MSISTYWGSPPEEYDGLGQTKGDKIRALKKELAKSDTKIQLSKDMLSEALRMLNKVPNIRLSNPNITTYELCIKIEQTLDKLK